MRWAYPSLLPSHWHYAAAATARTDGDYIGRDRSSLGSSLHWQRLIFSPANCGLTDQVARIGNHCLPRGQQQSEIHENNLTGRWRSLFQVSKFSNRRQLWSPPITCQVPDRFVSLSSYKIPRSNNSSPRAALILAALLLNLSLRQLCRNIIDLVRLGYVQYFL